MASPSRSLLLFLRLLLCFLLPASISAATLTFSLSPLAQYPPFPSSDPHVLLNELSASSRSRALHLRRSKQNSTAAKASESLVDAPLYSHSYGGYSITLGFGTPPQSIPLVFDTGSSLVWLPCTSRYSCSGCNFPDVSLIPAFIPRLSSSARIVGCSNPKCSWLDGRDPASRCGHCASRASCTCPPYIFQYGSGSTGGILLTETVTFPKRMTKAGVLIGCSVASMRQPAGIAGFGRDRESLPTQLGARRFSYCLQSRNFDDTQVSSELILETGPGQSGQKSAGASYTDLLRNPDKSNAAYQEFYYILLRRITIGDKHLKLPYKYSKPRLDGSGGTIIDSGSTFTFMERPIFDLVAREIEAQMHGYRRSVEAETKTGLQRCFKVSGTGKVRFPELLLHFKGGAEVALPPENYFALIGNTDVVCLTVVTDDGAGPELGSGGPAVILGSFQQQNLYVEYDLENERIGFRRQKCGKQ
ncbi:hypothetical protein MLD38_020302 [Melastoma candidum]|uniref:Uncharacterized protein n=1 Tax=Melastoma candidum TaxID=119954 RepID=A0ACB9QG94_9MYRT|nr:hypothetical protein MLD38_020302 [Melastoma candidum]